MENEIQGWRVLVADHSPTMARLIRGRLLELGLKPENITLARDGNQAFLYSELKPFDLVTSGMHMEWKDGLELLSLLRGSQEDHLRTIRFLMISSDGSPQVLADLMSSGGNGFLQKPFHPEDLKNTLCRMAEATNGDFIHLRERERALSASKEKSTKTGRGEEGAIPSGVVQAFVDSTLEGLGQYMVNARPGECEQRDSVTGDLVSSIDITDTKAGIKLTITLAFPKQAACNIYETLFGEVDLGMVCGIVGELGNIIAGSVKPRLESWGGAIYQLVFPNGEGPSPSVLDLQLGFPDCQWIAGTETQPATNGARQHFTLPFELDQGEMLLRVAFHPA